MIKKIKQTFDKVIDRLYNQFDVRGWMITGIFRFSFTLYLIYYYLKK